MVLISHHISWIFTEQRHMVQTGVYSQVSTFFIHKWQCHRAVLLQKVRISQCRISYILALSANKRLLHGLNCVAACKHCCGKACHNVLLNVHVDVPDECETIGFDSCEDIEMYEEIVETEMELDQMRGYNSHFRSSIYMD